MTEVTAREGATDVYATYTTHIVCPACKEELDLDGCIDGEYVACTECGERLFVKRG